MQTSKSLWFFSYGFIMLFISNTSPLNLIKKLSSSPFKYLISSLYVTSLICLFWIYFSSDFTASIKAQTFLTNSSFFSASPYSFLISSNLYISIRCLSLPLPHILFLSQYHHLISLSHRTHQKRLFHFLKQL